MAKAKTRAKRKPAAKSTSEALAPADTTRGIALGDITIDQRRQLAFAAKTAGVTLDEYLIRLGLDVLGGVIVSLPRGERAELQGAADKAGLSLGVFLRHAGLTMAAEQRMNDGPLLDGDMRSRRYGNPEKG